MQYINNETYYTTLLREKQYINNKFFDFSR